MSRLFRILGALGLLAAALLVALPANAAFPGRNGAIAIEGDTVPGIWSIHSNGKHLKQLTKHLGSGKPAYSPDGKKIAFVDHSQAIEIMRADGSGKRTITKDNAAGNGIDDGISWSPDGKHIVYTRTRTATTSNCGEDLFTIRANGKQKQRLTNDKLCKEGPSWSPKGDWIVFLRFKGGGKQVLYLIHPNGKGGHAIPSVQAFDPSGPDFSPDGKRVVFESLSTGTHPEGIFTMKLDGSDFTLLATNGKFNTDPVYSPDGKQVAYAANISESSTPIFRVSAAGGGTPKRVTPAGKHWFQPSWQPR